MSSEMNDYYKNENERLLPAIYLLVLVNWTTIELVNGNSFTQEQWLFFATRKIMKLIFSTVQESFKRKISNSKNAKIMNFSLKQAHNTTAEFINVMENTQNKILTTNKTLPTYLHAFWPTVWFRQQQQLFLNSLRNRIKFGLIN